MSEKNRKVVCGSRHCSWTGFKVQILTAVNPFDNAEILTACPKCKRIADVPIACDEDKCWEPVTCGTPTKDGYRSTCDEHDPLRQMQLKREADDAM